VLQQGQFGKTEKELHNLLERKLKRSRNVGSRSPKLRQPTLRFH
jgi:hypothetical protein